MSKNPISKPEITFDSANRTSKKYIIFIIEGFQFGVPVEQVSQVVTFEKVFDLPNMPEYVLGVINLRGKIVSLIHLANRLGLTKTAEIKGNKQVLFVDLGFETVGMLIDKVVTLKNISQDHITDDLDLISSRMEMEFLKGAALDETTDELIILLNLDMILTEYEVREILDHKERLRQSLEAKDEIKLSDEELVSLDLADDDFSSLGDFSN